MVVNVKIKPNAKQSSVIGFKNGYLQVSINEQPIEGKANEALIKLLSKHLSIAKSCIKLVKGFKSKFKRVEIGCLKEETIIKLLGGKQNADL